MDLSHRQVERGEPEEVELPETKEIELPALDLTPYIGKKVKIASVTEHKGDYDYYVKIITTPVDVLKSGKDLTASKIIGLVTNHETNEVGWTANGKMGKFLKYMQVKHYKELVGREVVVKTTEPTKEGRVFLTF